jgi:RNA polymerase sigma factor (sigma-70 family)
VRARLSDLLLGSQSDERLVSLARSGNERAFAAIVERYRHELYALARRLGSDGRAEDLVQQTFLSAFSAVQSGTEVKHLRGWLYQILRNAASRASSHPETELGFEAANIAGEPLEDAVAHRILAGDVLHEIAALPVMQRDALLVQRSISRL